MIECNNSLYIRLSKIINGKIDSSYFSDNKEKIIIEGYILGEHF
jgi:hypothetical protein